MFQNRNQDILGGILSETQSPPPLPQSPPPAMSSSPIMSPRIKSPEMKSPSKSPEPKGRKSITSIGSNGESSGEARARTPSPTRGMAPLPEIQITRTESNRSTVNEKWVRPPELDVDKGKPHCVMYGT